MRTVVATASFIVVMLAAVTACEKDAPKPAEPPKADTHTVDAKPAEPPPIAPRVAGPVGEALDAYDAMRLQLAHDDADGAKKSADRIAAAAKEAAQAASGPTKQPLTDLTAAAEKMAKAGEMNDVRAAFSELSKQVVTLLVADPSLQTGRFLFLCPMAKGYQKWVQTTTKLENPFFGKAMPDCGEQQKAWAV